LKIPKDIIGGLISLNDFLEPWVLNNFLFISWTFIFFLLNIGCRFCPRIGVGLAAICRGDVALPLLGVALALC
jgi:hypothetical protein